MERLTFEGNFCDIAQCRELPCPYNGACSQRKVWERMKAYEDTGLTPEQVEMDHESAEELRRLCRDCDLDRLEELAEADKDGRVKIVTRCKNCRSCRELNRTDRLEGNYTEGVLWCMNYSDGVWPDDFCSYGEPKETPHANNHD